MTGWTPPALPAQWTWTAQLPPLVGRRVELAQLEDIWAAVEHGARQLVLVAGEPGAGKSRLVMEAAWALHSHGVPVLVGACTSDFRLPLDPLVPPVRALLAAVDRGELALADAEGAPAAEARRLLAVLTSGVSSEATVETFAAVALGAVVSALTSACAHGPVVMVLEDLHWAGESGLRALRYIVERTANLPVMFLGTHRDTPPDASALVSVLTAELMRLPGVHRIDLASFDTGEVSSYLTAQHAGDAATIRSGAAMLRETTGGNPFLLVEVWRELQRHGGLGHLATGQITVPGSLRVLVSERLARLDPGDRDIVARGAVIGETFGVELVRASGLDPGRSAADVYGALAAAAAQGLVEVVLGVVGQYRFAHALARQAVLEAMDPYERASAHAAIALVLEGGSDPADPAVLTQLAHHFSMAVGLGLEHRAAGYLEKSADLAATRLAHSDAAGLFERAADLTPVGRERDELLVRAARSHIIAGHFHRARALGDAVATTGDREVRLEAAVDCEEAAFHGLGSGRAVDVLAAALDDTSLPQSDPLRVLAEAAYGRALVMSGRFGEGHAQLARTVARARALADEHLLLAVLTRSVTLAVKLTGDGGFDQMCSQREYAYEVTMRARRRGELRPLNVATQMRAFAAYILGDPMELDTALEELLLTGRVTNEPIFRWRGRCLMTTRHLLLCELGAARESLAEARRLGSTLDLPDDADGAWSLQSFMIRREFGGLDFARPAMVAGDIPQNTWVPGLLALCTELGLAQRARVLLHRSVEQGLRGLRDSSTWPAALSFLADATITFDDRRCADVLLPEAEFFASLNLMSSDFLAAFGSAHRAQAGLTAVLGRPGVEDHFAAALEMDTRMGSILHVATTRAEWAAWLRRSHASSARVDEQADHARDLAERHGLVRVRRLLGEDGAHTAGLGPGPDGLTTRELEVLRLIGRGRSNREIATDLFISEHTAANHVRSILMKTQSANRTAAARYAMRHRLLEDSSDDGHL
jgi:DNA-binding CsgD family transcriptional regulator